MSFLRRLTYWEPLRVFLRRVKLNSLLVRLYFRWTKPRDNILRVQVDGLHAQFHVRTLQELRSIEAEFFVERQTLEILARFLNPGDCFYDIGANVGHYAVLMAKKVGVRGQVIAFEPVSENYRCLQENVGLNQLTNVRCFQQALGDRDMQGALRIETRGISLGATFTSARMDGRLHEVVKIVQGDRFVRAEQLPVPRALQIDVEGYEHEVVQGLRHTLIDPACQLVCCEVHPHLLSPNTGPDVIPDLLKRLGFFRIHIVPLAHNDVHYVVAYKTG